MTIIKVNMHPEKKKVQWAYRNEVSSKVKGS